MKKIKLLIIACIGVMTLMSCDKAKASQSHVSAGFVTQNNDEIAQPYQIGDMVEDFSLKGVDGKMVSMSDYPNAKGFIVVFTCNTCPYSQLYEGRIKELASTYQSKGWPLIAINPNDPSVQEGDSYANMQSYAKEKGFTFPYLFDEGQKVYPKWGASRTPHVFIVSKQPNGYRLEYAGSIDDNARKEDQVTINYVTSTIQALEKGNSVDPTTTRAIGCTIKTK